MGCRGVIECVRGALLMAGGFGSALLYAQRGPMLEKRVVCEVEGRGGQTMLALLVGRRVV